MIAINNILLISSLLFIVISTPIFIVNNENVKMQSMIISKHLWVLLSTVILFFYYISVPYFCHNVSIVILAILIPCFMHFYNNTYLESRALSLCVLIIFDILNNSKKTINNFIQDSKYF
jgi:hypothetical protein